MYAGDQFTDAIDRTICYAFTSVKDHGRSDSCWSLSATGGIMRQAYNDTRPWCPHVRRRPICPCHRSDHFYVLASIEDHGQSGSCWSFSATGSIRRQAYLETRLWCHFNADMNWMMPLTGLFWVQSPQSRLTNSAPHAGPSQPLDLFSSEPWCLLYERVYNGDKVNAEQQAWYIANATHIAEHNAKSETFQLGGTQFIDLRQEKYWAVAGLGFKASDDRHTTTLDLGNTCTPT